MEGWAHFCTTGRRAKHSSLYAMYQTTKTRQMRPSSAIRKTTQSKQALRVDYTRYVLRSTCTTKTHEEEATHEVQREAERLLVDDLIVARHALDRHLGHCFVLSCSKSAGMTCRQQQQHYQQPTSSRTNKVREYKVLLL